MTHIPLLHNETAESHQEMVLISPFLESKCALTLIYFFFFLTNKAIANIANFTLQRLESTIALGCFSLAARIGMSGWAHPMVRATPNMYKIPS